MHDSVYDIFESPQRFQTQLSSNNKCQRNRYSKDKENESWEICVEI